MFRTFIASVFFCHSWRETYFGAKRINEDGCVLFVEVFLQKSCEIFNFLAEDVLKMGRGGCCVDPFSLEACYLSSFVEVLR